MHGRHGPAASLCPCTFTPARGIIRTAPREHACHRRGAIVLDSDDDAPPAEATECEDEDSGGEWLCGAQAWEGQLLPPRLPKSDLPDVAAQVEALFAHQPPGRLSRERMQQAQQAGEPGPMRKRKGKASFFRGMKKFRKPPAVPTTEMPPPAAASAPPSLPQAEPAAAAVAPPEPETKPAAAAAPPPPARQLPKMHHSNFALPPGAPAPPNPGSSWTLLNLQEKTEGLHPPLACSPPLAAAPHPAGQSCRVMQLSSDVLRELQATQHAGPAASGGRGRGKASTRKWPGVKESATSAAAAPPATQPAAATPPEPAAAKAPPKAAAPKPAAETAPEPLPVPADMPEAALPQSDKRGRLSYTVRAPSGAARVEVLLHAKAFRVKHWGGDDNKPPQHVSWIVYGGPGGAWQHAIEQGLKW